MSSSDSFYLGAYWRDSRKLDNLGAMLARVLTSLGHFDQHLATWYRKAKSRRKAKMQPVAIEPGSLTKLLASSVTGNASGGCDDFIGEGVVGFWNGRDGDESAGIVLSFNVSSGAQWNAFTLSIPDLLTRRGKFVEGKECRGLMTEIVIELVPDWAGIVSRTHRNLVQHPIGEPCASTMLYVSRRIEAASMPSEKGVEVSEVNALGKLFYLKRSFSVNDPEALKAAEQMNSMGR